MNKLAIVTVYKNTIDMFNGLVSFNKFINKDDKIMLREYESGYEIIVELDDACVDDENRIIKGSEAYNITNAYYDNRIVELPSEKTIEFKSGEKKTLYKNVSLYDLNNILAQGILPISKTKNNNWSRGRADNSEDVVYLFEPKIELNTFRQYGAVLLEVEVNRAIENGMVSNDVNIGKYNEYIIDEVSPEQIKNVYLPYFLKNEATKTLSQENLNKVIFCDVEMDFYGRKKGGSGKDIKLEITDELVDIYSEQINPYLTSVYLDKWYQSKYHFIYPVIKKYILK